MRWFGRVVVASVLLFIAPGCTARAPVAPLGRVSETHALRVRLRREPNVFRFDLGGARFRVADGQRLLAETQEATASFHHVLAGTLQRAGYDVTDDGPCDVHIVRELSFEAEQRQRRHGNISLGDLVGVVFHVYDTEGREIDRFDLVPSETLETPEGIAVDLVNAMLRSPKVASYAATRRSSGPADVADHLPGTRATTSISTSVSGVARDATPIPVSAGRAAPK